jgi:hypothetical protein
MTIPIEPIEKLGPPISIPLPRDFTDVESYVESLLHFSTSSALFQALCGGVHILDFFTQSPDLYSQILPTEWRTWFKKLDIHDLLDLLMREDLDHFGTSLNEEQHANGQYTNATQWRNSSSPPLSLILYIENVRSHLLSRNFTPTSSKLAHKLDRNTSVGMNVKKAHEVSNFANYVDILTTKLSTNKRRKISHLIDFGAGQNYLGRALASHPYNRDIIAIESRTHVVDGARKMDVAAKLVERELVLVNKKEYRALRVENGKQKSTSGKCSTLSHDKRIISTPDIPEPSERQKAERYSNFLPSGHGRVLYIEHRIEDGHLQNVIQKIPELEQPNQALAISEHDDEHEPEEPGQMVISLHSCGNLLHHGLRTIVLNPTVQAVALVGCCYNLLTERLGPPTFKIPTIRQEYPRLEATGNACDPHGFPMSKRLLEYRRPLVRFNTTKNSKYGSLEGAHEQNAEDEVKLNDARDYEEGIRFNITARMMAVQAPQNWSEHDSASFFTRHFYRALLQRIFLDKGIFKPLLAGEEGIGRSPAGTSNTAPIIIGTLSKKCYVSFPAYVRGAVAKIIGSGAKIGKLVEEKMGEMGEEEILEYEVRFGDRKKELSIVWSLMAFSAGVVEAVIVVDRWAWLMEQECIEEAWVEAVFEYGKSPRNLVVVGVKK